MAKHLNHHAYPPSHPGDTVDLIHGTPVPDPFRWLEDGKSPRVRGWEEAQALLVREALDALPYRTPLAERLEALWRYDDKSPPVPCKKGERLFYTSRKAHQDKGVLHLKLNAEDEGRVVLDPNTWGVTETLEWWTPSPDGRYLAYGRARAGDEAPVVTVLDLDTDEVLGDTLTGRRHGNLVWRPDNSGFWFSGYPLEGTVPPGEHNYWHRVWYHRLGTQAAEDVKVFSHPTVKEFYHAAVLSDCGRWLVLLRVAFDKRQLFVLDLERGGEPEPLMEEADWSYEVQAVDGHLFVLTDWQAPRGRIMRARLDAPRRDRWEEIVPEGPHAKVSLEAVGGRLYVEELHNAATRFTIFDTNGRSLGEVPLPALGNASLWGSWSRPDVWVGFESFAAAPATWRYHPEDNRLELYRPSPIRLDTSALEMTQVWYPSKDGTQVSMFLLRRRDAPRDGSTPMILNGYGGFNIAMQPRFATVYAMWVLAGGALAVPNLRGGGEYGAAWHEAGMRERKQNVFDDFIAAAEYLCQERYTSREKLAILGGSNGGLLVGACMTQRPDLYKAVVCQVPLIDMIRYHHFGLANIWSLEYGNSDDPALFKHILAYSPYHHVREGVQYPAILITGSENDARTDALHARKFGAALQHANKAGAPVLVSIQRESGHGGAVTIEQRASQWADVLSFLAHELGLGEAIAAELG